MERTNRKTIATSIMLAVIVLAIAFMALFAISPAITAKATPTAYEGGETLTLDALQVGDVISGAYGTVTGQTITNVRFAAGRYSCGAQPITTLPSDWGPINTGEAATSLVNNDGMVCFHSNYSFDFYPLTENGELGTAWVVTEIKDGAVYFGGQSSGGQDIELALTFGKVTDVSQITEENIGECTFAEPKQWIYNNWDEVFADAEDSQSFDFFYYAENDYYYIPVRLEDYATKDVFDANCTGAYDDFFENIALYLSDYGEIVYLCDPSSVSGGGSGSGEQPSYDSLAVSLSEDYLDSLPWGSTSDEELEFPTEALSITPAFPYIVDDSHEYAWANYSAEYPEDNRKESVTLYIRCDVGDNASTLQALFEKGENLAVTLNGSQRKSYDSDSSTGSTRYYYHHYICDFGVISINYVDRESEMDHYALFITIYGDGQSGEQPSYDSLAVTVDQEFIETAPWTSQDYCVDLLPYLAGNLTITPAISYDINDTENVGASLYTGQENMAPQIVIMIRKDKTADPSMVALFDKGQDLAITLNGNTQALYYSGENNFGSGVEYAHQYVSDYGAVIISFIDYTDNTYQEDRISLQIVIPRDGSQTQGGGQQSGGQQNFPEGAELYVAGVDILAAGTVSTETAGVSNGTATARYDEELYVFILTLDNFVYSGDGCDGSVIYFKGADNDGCNRLLIQVLGENNFYSSSHIAAGMITLVTPHAQLFIDGAIGNGTGSLSLRGNHFGIQTAGGNTSISVYEVTLLIESDVYAINMTGTTEPTDLLEVTADSTITFSGGTRAVFGGRLDIYGGQAWDHPQHDPVELESKTYEAGELSSYVKIAATRTQSGQSGNVKYFLDLEQGDVIPADTKLMYDEDGSQSFTVYVDEGNEMGWEQVVSAQGYFREPLNYEVTSIDYQSRELWLVVTEQGGNGQQNYPEGAELWVAGVDILAAGTVSTETDGVSGGTASVVFDVNEFILTIENFAYSGEGYNGSAIYFKGSEECNKLTIVVIGENSFECSSAQETGIITLATSGAGFIIRGMNNSSNNSLDLRGNYYGILTSGGRSSISFHGVKMRVEANEAAVKMVYSEEWFEIDSYSAATLLSDTTAVEGGRLYLMNGGQAWDDPQNDPVALGEDIYTNDQLSSYYKIVSTYDQSGQGQGSDEPQPEHTHNDITFTAWESTTSLPNEAGNWYLTADVTISSTWSVPAGTTNLCLNGFGIKKTGSNDSAVYVPSSAILNIYDCKDTEHKFTVDGNSIATIDDSLTSGYQTFTGGYITGGRGKASTGNKNGGGVFIDGECNLYGGNIIGNSVTVSDNCGAGVFLNDNSLFRMYGGSISYNYAQNAGCAVFAWHNSEAQIYGGEISHNKTSHASGSAISFWNQNGYTVSLKWYGGFVHDNLTGSTGGAVSLSATGLTVGMKGAPIVKDNTTASTNGNATLNVYVSNTPINIEGALTNTEKIGLRLASGVGTFTSGWSTYMGNADPANYFYSENEAYHVYLLDGEAAILAEAPAVPHTHGDITFTAWESTNSLPTEAGNYYLTADVTLTSTWSAPSGTTNLCLNGYGIILGSYRNITVRNSGATLNLYDCGSTVHYYDVDAEGMATNVNDVAGEDRQSFIGGYITRGVYGGGGAIWVENATFNMYGGTILGNSASVGGGVYVSESTGTINLHGGKIMHNKATSASDGGGGGVYLAYGATFSMYGGEISYNYTASDGGGVAFPSGTFSLFGGTIAHNVAAGNGGGIYKHTSYRKMYLSGAPVVEDNTAGGAGNDLYINVADDVLNISEELTQGATIGVALSGGTGVFTSGWSTYMDGVNPASYFVSENDAYQVYLLDGEAAILAEAPVLPHTHNDITFTAWESTTSLPSEAGNWYLTADVTISSSWSVPSGTTNLCLNGHGIKMTSGNNSVITVGNGAVLNVYDCGDTTHYFDVHSNGYATDINDVSGSNSFTGGYITGGQGTDLGGNRVLGGGFFVNGGTLHMYGGTVIGNYMTREFVKGAGVWVGYNGTFIMEEGAYIKYNWSDNVGGGVGVGAITDLGNSSGTFVMNGGEISHNRAAAGGGIILRAGEIALNGGTVAYNSARDSGGAIDYEYQSVSTLMISGDPVINNNSIYSANGTGDNVVLRGNTIPKIVLTGALTSGANIHLMTGHGFPPTATEGVFTSGWSTYMDGVNPADYFVSDNDAYGVYLLDGEAAILAEDPNASAVTLGTGVLYVGGVDIVTAENYTVNGNGGGTAVLSEDAQGNPVLTLTNYVYTGAGHSDGWEGGAIDFRTGYENGLDLTILLVGNNTITKTDDGGTSCSHGIYFASYNHSLIIDGEGTLTTNFAGDRSGCFKSNGIFLEPGTFVMNGGTVVSNGGIGSEESLGIYSNQSIVFNGGSFTGNGYTTYDWHSFGIYCSNITVNGGTVYASSPLDNGEDDSCAFQNSTLTINGGTVTAYGQKAFSSTWGIHRGECTWTVFAGDEEASATEVSSIPEAQYVRIVAQIKPPYKPLDPEQGVDIDVPDDKEEAEDGDELTVDTDATPVDIKWYYDDDGDGIPDGDPIGEGDTYEVEFPKDEGHTIIAVITQDEDENGNPYADGQVPTVTTNGVIVPVKYDLYIVGVQVTSTNLSGDGWSYDPAANALTLNGFTYEGEGSDDSNYWRFNSVVTYAGDDPFTVILVGDSGITNTKTDYENIMAFFSTADLTIGGSGSLTLSVPGTATNMSMGLCVDGDLTVDGGSVTAIGGESEWRSAGICVFGKRYIQEGGSVTAIGGFAEEESYGLYVLGREQLSSALEDDGGAEEDIGDGITICSDIKRLIAVGHTSALYTEAVIDLKTNGKAWRDVDKTADGETIAVGKYENAALAEYAYIDLGRDSYKALDPDDHPEIEVPEEKEEAEDGDTLTVDPDAEPVEIEWYYDDDGDGFPDDPEHPIGTGPEYEVKLPKDGGHTIIAKIKQTKDENGEDYPDGQEPTAYSKPVNVVENSRWVIKMRAKTSVPSSYVSYIDEGETIVRVYDVTLYRIDIKGGVEQEPILMQPSAVKKDGTGTITVKLTIPSLLSGKTFRILHVHAADDYAFVDFTTDEEGKHVIIRGVDKLSDFAFVAKEEDLTPSDPDSGEQGQGGEGQGVSQPQGGDEGQGDEGQSYKPLEKEPEITKEDDPTKENLPLVPQGGQGGSQGQGGSGEQGGKQGQGDQGEQGQPAKPAVTVALEDMDPEDAVGVTVEVEVKTEVSEEVTQSENNVLSGSLQSDDEIAIVYDVKLIRTTIENGIEIREEIQPSDIKAGTIVSITMEIPEALRGKPFRLLHIHSEEDIKEVTSYKVSDDGATLTVRVDRLSEFAFIGKVAADIAEAGPNKIPDGAIAGIVIGGSFGLLFIGLLIFFLLKRREGGEYNAKANEAAPKAKVAEKKEAPEKKAAEIIVAAIAANEASSKGFYRITEDEAGKCTFALFYEKDDALSKEMGVFDSEEEAKEAIRVLRTKGDGVKAENRVRHTEESILAPKFVLDVDADGVYKYSFLSEDGSILLQSVKYLNEKRCLEDLKKALVCITTGMTIAASGAVQSGEIEAVAVEETPAEEAPIEEKPVEEAAENVTEEAVEDGAADKVEALAEETPAEEDSTEEAPAESELASYEDAEEMEESDEGVSLAENIAIAKEVVSHGYVDKQYVAEYLAQQYGSDVACVLRNERTKTGLPLADTHYVVGEDSKLCFAYVYQIGGTTMLLLKVDDEYGQALAEKHPIVKRSAFPKSKSPWYSVILDDSFDSEEIEKVLDDAYLMNGGKPVED